MRYLHGQILKDLQKKMVFVGGPRQVGKTTLALSILAKSPNPPLEFFDHPAYLNWDVLQSKSRLMRGELPAGEGLVILDEIHKFKRWRNLVKGFYDQFRGRVRFIVTGSARLDFYRRGGDSLQGRYHYLRLHPYSLMELAAAGVPDSKLLNRLLEFGGFPEPFHGAEKTEWRRWQKERLNRVVEEDLRDLEHVQDVSLIHLLLEALPERVGSPVSLNKLAQVLEVSHPTLKRYLTILDNLYLTYRISPFGSPKIRAVKKEQKLYFWDWSPLEDPGIKFENLVASQLLKFCHHLEDTMGFPMELRFLRDTDGREVDFVVLQGKRPLFAVECKTGEKAVSKNIAYFKARTKIPKFYQVHLGTKDFGNCEVLARVMPFTKFCQILKMP